MIVRNRLIKLSTTGLFGLLALACCFFGEAVGAFSGGPPASRTGAPALGTFAAEPTCTACHAGTVNSGGGTLTLTGVPANYTPGQEVTLTVTVTQPDRMRYGFQLTALTDDGQKAGDLVVTDTARTQLRAGAGGFAGRQYIEHTLTGVAPSGANQGSWSFTWRAPAQSVGRVTFYVAGNAANGNFANSGDFIYTINSSSQPAALAAVSTVSAASFAPAGMLAPESIVAAFGGNLADSTMVSNTVPLPTELGGAKVRVRDSAGMERDAGLFFVSAQQINYLIPAGTASGAATITFLRNNTPVGAGTATIDATAPGLFSANASGQGVAAAVLVRVRADGTQSFEPVVRFDSGTNRFVAVPIELGAETDQLVLLLFGTGIRGRASLSDVVAQIGGANSEVMFAGPAPGFIGLDQLNVRLSRTLGGRGDVNVALTVGGKAANVVTINVR